MSGCLSQGGVVAGLLRDAVEKDVNFGWRDIIPKFEAIGTGQGSRWLGAWAMDDDRIHVRSNLIYGDGLMMTR